MSRRPRHLPLVAALAATACAWAADFSALRPQGYLSDFAGVVDAVHRRQIESYCAALEQATGAQIALVTLPSLEGDPVEDVANLLFRRWGVGQKGENNGALLLLSINDRRSRLEVGYGLEPILPDGYAGGLLRQMRPELREARYGAALLVAAQQIGAKIAQAKGVEINAPVDPGPRRRIHDEAPFPWFVVIALVLALLFLFGGGGPWWLLWNILGSGRSRGWHSSGGFGGYDSGGGFGGFGGGDSGGGGASSDW
jgi:uncharacterized protein